MWGLHFPLQFSGARKVFHIQAVWRLRCLSRILQGSSLSVIYKGAHVFTITKDGCYLPEVLALDE